MSGDHNMYGDGTIYRGERSKDSAVPTYTVNDLAYSKGMNEPARQAMLAMQARLTEAERVMKQALEALEAMNPYPASQEDQRDAAITALRERLEGKK